MVLLYLVFRPVGSKLVHPQQALNVSLLVCSIRNYCCVDSVSELSVAALAVSYHTSQSGSRLLENPLRLRQHVQGVFPLVLVRGSKGAGQKKQCLRSNSQVKLVAEHDDMPALPTLASSSDSPF